MRERKRAFSTSLIIRTLVTAGILIALGLSIDLSQVARILTSLDYCWIMGACGFIMGVRFIGALRWQYILASQGMDVPLGRLFTIINVSIPIGRLSPVPESTTLVKGYQLMRHYGQSGTVAGTIITDRFIGFSATVFTAFLGIFIALSMGISNTLIFHLLMVNLVFIVGGALLFTMASKLKLISIFDNTRLQSIWLRVLSHCAAITDKNIVKATYPTIISLSLIVSVARCVIYYCLYHSLGEAIGFLYFILFIPLVAIVLLVPISLGGLGVRELSLVYLFGTTGVSAETSISAGILLEFLQIVLSLPFFAVPLPDKRRIRPPSP